MMLATHAPRTAHPPVDAWGAERIVNARRSGMNAWQVGLQYGVHQSTVDRIYAHWLETGKYRVPQQGKGKRDDPRWSYAGPRAAGNIRALESAHGAGGDEDLLQEVWHRHLAQGICSPGYSTMTAATRTQLDMTTKRLTRMPIERDEAKCDIWITRMQRYSPDDLVLLDETCDSTS